jgi:hypothetical protein
MKQFKKSITIILILLCNSVFSQTKTILIYLNVDKFDDMVSIKFIKDLERGFKECKIKSKRVYEYRHVLHTEHDSLIIKKHLDKYNPNLLFTYTVTDTKIIVHNHYSYSHLLPFAGLLNSSLSNVYVLRNDAFNETKYRFQIELTDLDNKKVIDRNVITDLYFTGYFNELKYNKVLE